MLIFYPITLIVAGILGYLIAHNMSKAGLGEWKKKYDLKSNEFTAIDRKYKDSSRLASDFEGKNKTLTGDNERYRKEIEEWKNKYNRVKSDYDARARVASDYDALNKKYGDLEERYKGNELTIKDLIESNKQLESERNALSEKQNQAVKAERKTETSKAPEVKTVVDDRKVKELEDKLRTLRQRNDKLELDFNSLNKSVDTITVGKKKVEAELEQSLAEIQKLKAQLASADSKTDLESLKAQYNSLKLKHDAHEKSVNQLQTTNGDLLKQISTLGAGAAVASTGGGDEFKAKFENCQEEVAKLKQELANAKTVTTPPTPATALTPKEAKQQEVLRRVREKAANIDFARIGMATETEKDDLKLIKGIGPFIEDKLNALGIYTFRQISNFNEEDDDKVNDAIEFFPGRVKRDDWKGQAKEFLKA